MIKTQSYLSSRAPKRALVFAPLLAAICALVMPMARASADAPVLSISATERDFGDVYKGELLEQVFTVRNDGTAPLTLAEKSLTGQADPSRDARAAITHPRSFNEALRPVALFTRRAAPS